jgi:hypothetical protein
LTNLCVNISRHYGAQAVVVSIDPKRVYVQDPSSAPGKVVMPLRKDETGPNGERYCWWQVTVKGGRETRDLCAVTLAKVSLFLFLFILFPLIVLSCICNYLFYLKEFNLAVFYLVFMIICICTYIGM